MIFIFGLITGFMFDMPIWWWILGFIIGIFDIMTTPSGNIYIMNKFLDFIKNTLLLLLTIIIISCILILPFQIAALTDEVKKLQQIEIEIYKQEQKRFHTS